MPTRRQVLALGALLTTAACGRAATGRSTPSAPTGTTSSARPTPTPTASPTHTGPAVEVSHGPRTGDAVALTFHGAGDLGIAEQVLTTAEQAGARLTIFAVGSWLVAEPTVAHRILAGGHELANHTYSHLSTLPQLPQAEVLTEVARCRDVIRQQTGQTGGHVRPSATQYAPAQVLAAEGQAGYATSTSYDVDPLDYTDPGAALVASRVAAATQPGSIVSLHLGHTGTLQALPTILEGLRRKGLRAVTVTELLG